MILAENCLKRMIFAEFACNSARGTQGTITSNGV
ncbi:hypothetical protein T09_9778, partial [Trichinella sp. T9]